MPTGLPIARNASVDMPSQSDVTMWHTGQTSPAVVPWSGRGYLSCSNPVMTRCAWAPLFSPCLGLFVNLLASRVRITGVISPTAYPPRSIGLPAPPSTGEYWRLACS